MDAEAYRNKTVPSADSLYEEAQALMFGGADTVGTTLMVGTYHLLQQPDKLQRMKAELMSAWPSLNKPEPTLRELENLRYLNAIIKESLRIASGVVSGLLRVVPPAGAVISGVAVPPGVSSRLGPILKEFFINSMLRRLFHVAALLFTTTLLSSLSLRSSFQSAGWRQTTWTIGLLPFHAVHACV